MIKPSVVYIAGSHRSGSTLLNLLLGASENVFSVGELKYLRRDLQENVTCDCGESLDQCTFWSNIDVRQSRLYNLPSRISDQATAPLESFDRLRDAALFSQLLEHARGIKGKQVEHILTSSKTFRRLVSLTKQDIDLKVIHLVRDGRGVINSTDKKGIHWFRTYIGWSLMNTAIAMETRMSSAQSVTISYEDVCAEPGKTLDRISDELNIPTPSEHVQAVREESYHNFAGNRMRSKKFDGLDQDLAWTENFPAWKKVVTTALTKPLYHLWQI